MMVININNYHLKLYLFLGLSVGAMSTATFVIIRSMVSKIVSRSEVGSIFSLISSLDSLIPILIAPGLTELYKVTIDFFPGKYTNWRISPVINIIFYGQVPFIWSWAPFSC